MKAISLHQPYASYVASGAKRIETRSKPTRYRGLIAIHAAKKYGAQERETHQRLNLLLYQVGREDLATSCLRVPLGKIVAVATLADCLAMTPGWISTVDGLEREFGNYARGRYAWILKNVRYVRGICVTGRQWLWTLDSETATKVELASGVVCL